MTAPQLSRHTGLEASSLLDGIADVYDEVYSEPPYNSGPLFARSAFLERTRSQLGADGFALVTAEVDGKFAGFSFGFSLGSRWWGGDTSSSPPHEIQKATKFAVIELVVRRPFRGSGLGSGLLAELLVERSEEYATLLSVPEAPAHAMYERWNWRTVGTVQPRADAPVMDAMVKELHS
ncbi:GNAT family N-acetyltransferase [Actinomadura roseirufa]|uniref:GNAT family N-acetyltransferase n=1 Tax=Actinomadura roseirufa TaxID=2094049 RepID=UPI001041485D|nr:GNAT family N-acetyltransferase [Actinomadura roseirufa]